MGEGSTAPHCYVCRRLTPRSRLATCSAVPEVAALVVRPRVLLDGRTHRPNRVRIWGIHITAEAPGEFRVRWHRILLHPRSSVAVVARDVTSCKRTVNEDWHGFGRRAVGPRSSPTTDVAHRRCELLAALTIGRQEDYVPWRRFFPRLMDAAAPPMGVSGVAWQSRRPYPRRGGVGRRPPRDAPPAAESDRAKLGQPRPGEE